MTSLALPSLLMPISSQFYVMFVLQVGLLSGTSPVVDGWDCFSCCFMRSRQFYLGIGSNAVSFYCCSDDVQIHLI